MSLNHLRLTPHLLARLYRDVLVEMPVAPRPDAATPTLGGNAKKILIVVKSDAAAVLPEPELQFLSAILAACKLHLGDVLLVNWSAAPAADYKTLLQQYESRFILLFDVSPVQFGLPMAFPPFQIQAFDTRQYLFAPALQKIKEHKGIKAELWTALQKLFML